MITKPKKDTCQNCHQAPAHCRDRCYTCYVYLINHGKDRPARLFQKHCSRCGRPVHARGLCQACYWYERVRGKSRPDYLLDPQNATCRNPNCRKPLRLAPYAAAGYCRPCYRYRRYHGGQNRPRELTGGPGPWCDCGQPATRRHAVQMGFHGRKATPVILDLCEDCYRLETGHFADQSKPGQSHLAA